MFKSLIFLVLTMGFALSASAQGAIENVLENTDPALAAAMHGAMAVQPPFTVPPPASISDGRYTDTPPAEYMPIHKKAVFQYEYTSSEFPGSKVIRVEYMSYSDKDKTAAVNMVVFNRYAPKVINYVVTADAYGVRSSDSPLYGPRLEFPLPLRYNTVWHEGPDRHRAAALNAKVETPAGPFHGCLKVKTYLSGGDAGSAERYYAPGVGLVYEKINSEDRQETIKLVSYQLK